MSGRLPGFPPRAGRFAPFLHLLSPLDPSTPSLKDTRKAAGLSSTALAALCGIPEERLRRFETCAAKPTPGELQLLAQALGGSVEAREPA
jgi:hypothetical protein